jgi:hypothetical protein
LPVTEALPRPDQREGGLSKKWPSHVNYFNYFTEIEEHFQRKRGAQILLSPVDWALIASWREAGIPLAAAIAGIDAAFEKFESGRRRDRRPRALIYCAPAVLDAAETMRAAAVGAAGDAAAAGDAKPADAAFSRERVLAHLDAALASLRACPLLAPASPVVAEALAALERARAALAAGAPLELEALDRLLTVLDDKLHAAALEAAPVDLMVRLRAETERELAPYRRQLRVEQLDLIERQFLRRRLLEHARLRRLSLFYMG